MKTELTANQGDKLLDGKTEFMYSDDDEKKITAEYTIETSSDDTIRSVIFESRHEKTCLWAVQPQKMTRGLKFSDLEDRKIALSM